MAKQLEGFYHLRTNPPNSERRQYPSLDGVGAAMTDLVSLQKERGIATTTDTDHRRWSRHPDGRMVQFWAENEKGEIVE